MLRVPGASVAMLDVEDDQELLKVLSRQTLDVLHNCRLAYLTGFALGKHLAVVVEIVHKCCEHSKEVAAADHSHSLVVTDNLGTLTDCTQMLRLYIHCF